MPCSPARRSTFLSWDSHSGLACGLLVGAWVMQYTMAYILAGVVQRTMYGLRADVEEKLNRLPLSYVDRAHRGDLLSRVTNDIDNIAQTLQQTLSQMLTQVLMLVGTVAMMIWISWLLALVAIVSIPMSMWLMRAIAKRSRTRFMAQWRHTGDLNAQVEETFTGHAIVKGFGRQREVEEVFRATNDQLYEASFSARSSSQASSSRRRCWSETSTSSPLRCWVVSALRTAR